MIRCLIVGLLAFFVTGTPSAAETYKVKCTLDKYQPSQRYSEEFMRSWIPENLIIDHKSMASVQIFYPSINRRFRGEGFRENSKKFSMRFNVQDTRKANVSFTLNYFKESNKIYMSGEGGAGYAPLGDASGTCEDINFSPKPNEQAAVSSSQSPVTPLSQQYPSQPATVSRSKPGVFVPPSSQAGWEERSLALNWDGVSDLMAGKIYIKQGERSGRLSIDLPGGAEKCSGTYNFGSKVGTWAVACPDGTTASGTYKGFGSGKGAGGDREISEGRLSVEDIKNS